MYYKDMEVWKEAIDLTTEIYSLTKTFPEHENLGIVNQMQRCAVSIPSNIAEGSARQSDKDTLKFIDIAIGSLAELDTQLIISERLGYITNTDTIKTQIDKLFALLRGLKNTYNKKRKELNLLTS